MACNGACCSANQACCSNRCVTLNSNENCGLCGNACTGGKVCTGTQCLWPDGHLCASPADCASGSCGGRCCPAGTSCQCTQPTSVNMLPNPSFDTGISGWTASGGSVAGGSVTWISGASGDAESCPFSGGIRVVCPLSTQAYCYINSACFAVPQFKDYNLGYRENSAQFGPNVCGLELFEGVGCTGASAENEINFYLGPGWSPTLFRTINSGTYQSVRVFCYATTTDADVTFDMLYLSPSPGGY